MAEPGDGSIWQSAVIAIRTQDRLERLVIANPDEKTLRMIIAASSIIALGYDSADQAVADSDRFIPVTVASRRKSTQEAVSKNRKLFAEIRAPKKRFTDPHRHWWPESFLGHLLQHSVAAAIVLFYSKNILAAILRAFVSF
jgi:hypothetical protein